MMTATANVTPTRTFVPYFRRVNDWVTLYYSRNYGSYAFETQSIDWFAPISIAGPE